MKHIVLPDWSEFEGHLRSELKAIGHHWWVTVRNFERISSGEDGEVDRFELALRTGTDRDASSAFWNAEGHDHEHDRQPRGKRPDEIIYAFTLALDHTPYKVLHDADVEDVTEGLDERHAVLVYKTSELDRMSANEYWFKTVPKDAALLIISVKDPEQVDEADEGLGDG